MLPEDKGCFMGFIFDLDGTLLDSISDLGNAMNVMLKRHNYPVHTLETYKTFVGNGIHKLVERSLPAHVTDVDAYYNEYLEIYGAAYCNDSYLYNGVLETLKILNNRGIPIAIHTNKMQVYTDEIVRHYLKDIDFVAVIGDQRDGHHKPDPLHTAKIADKMNCDKIYFVGDSDVDMKTALNAGLIPVGVSWGFRSVEELKHEGAKHMLQSFNELLKLVD